MNASTTVSSNKPATDFFFVLFWVRNWKWSLLNRFVFTVQVGMNSQCGFGIRQKDVS